MTGSGERRRPRWLRRLQSLLGFGAETRVHVSAPGIDVVISGRPSRVRSVLDVVTKTLEREEAIRRARTRPAAADRSIEEGDGPPGPKKARRLPPAGSVVEPTELDDMDSPYALPELGPPVRAHGARTVAVEVAEAENPMTDRPDGPASAEATFEIPGRRRRPPPRAPSLTLEEPEESERTAVELPRHKGPRRD